MNSLTLALYALQRDVRHYERLNNDMALDQVERVEYGEYVLDLTKAIGEFCGIYQEQHKDYPELPDIVELMQTIEKHVE